MEKVISKLKELAKEVSLENYHWDIPEKCPIKIPQKSNHEQNIFLKHNLNQALENDYNLEKSYWIIQEWGGIKSLKRSDRNNETIIHLRKQLERKKLSRKTFTTISSMSKIASFLEPEKYAIYDSRVIYALNWILFTCSDIKQLFPQPNGRNSELAKYDLQTIIRLKDDGHEYRSYKYAYHEYCELLQHLSEMVYEKSYPYLVEMLLFIIAPQQIVNDIRKRTKVIFT